MSRKEDMRMKKKIEYAFGDTKVTFLEEKGFGEYTHRVIVNQKSVDRHHGKYATTKTAARYYYKKHILKVDNPSLLERTLRKDKKHLAHTKDAFIQWLDERQFQNVGEVSTMSYGKRPLDIYIKEMREAEQWKGSFLHDGLYDTMPRWMVRFNNFCVEQTELFDNSVKGFEVLALLRKSWDKPAYDMYTFHERMTS